MPARVADLAGTLDIPLPEDPRLALDGCRRLLGPNLHADSTGAVGDASMPGVDAAGVLALWQAQARHLCEALGWQADVVTRPFAGGGSLFVPARADRLMTAAFLIEAAWHLAASAVLGRAALAPATLAADLRDMAASEANPALLRLTDEARLRGIDRLLDDDALTLGHGTGARTWDTADLPAAPDWDALHDIPLALITGTNGKTTTTRLLAAMGRAAGRVAGLSSTDFVRVGDDILDHGDYSGPAGARLLLRSATLEFGVLEVARGGILRRGLPVTRAGAAVVTNVAADHLGQYGINTVEQLAAVKLAVRRGLRPGGRLILNAGDALLRQAGAGLPAPVWFATDPALPEIARARAEGRPCGWLADGGVLMLAEAGRETALIAAAEVPLTLGGAALYNVENALAAALAARALGLPDAAIAGTLADFRSDADQNPGRANEFAVHGARVFVDFAHNPHSIAAVTRALAAIPARRRLVLLMHAGDRSDAEITALVDGAFALAPAVVVVAENPAYLRGRPPGEIPALMGRASLAHGLAEGGLVIADTPQAGAAALLDRLRPGDLALLLAHADRQAIFDLIRARQAGD